ncbi:MAG: hypothetical protein WB761_24230 [Solirubrobacteraceae bacterium]
MALIVLPTTVPVLTVALISVGVDIGLGVSVVLDLAVLGSGPRDAGVTASVNTVTRIIGSALGSQVATAVVIIAAPPLASGFPSHSGFHHAFILLAGDARRARCNVDHPAARRCAVDTRPQALGTSLARWCEWLEAPRTAPRSSRQRSAIPIGLIHDDRNFAGRQESQLDPEALEP